MIPEMALVRCRLDDALICICVYDVPRRNALSAQMASELRTALRETEGAASIVLPADGRHFCASGNHGGLSWLTPDQLQSYRSDLTALFRRPVDSQAPLVVAVQGAAIAGDSELAVPQAAGWRRRRSLNASN